MKHEDQREFYSCPLCGAGMGNDIDNAVHGVPEHECEVEKEMREEDCPDCGGTGEVTVMERVYPNEPHMAPIGTAKCTNIIHDKY